MPNPRHNSQVAHSRGGANGWKTGSIPYTYPGSGKNGIGAYDQHNSDNKTGAYDASASKASKPSKKSRAKRQAEPMASSMKAAY